MNYSNVFVLCTGRCGSTTLAAACHHFTNYTAGHETRSALLGDDRFAYPEKHIEADNRLSWMLGRLDRHFGDAPFFVHLMRDPEKVAQSYSKRYGGIMLAYQGNGIVMGTRETDQLKIARDYCDTVTANIEHFLATKPNKMTFHLENGEEDFRRLAEAIGAEGDIEAGAATFRKTMNVGRKRSKLAEKLRDKKWQLQRALLKY